MEATLITKREEREIQAEMGNIYGEYTRRVPAFFPKIGSKKVSLNS